MDYFSELKAILHPYSTIEFAYVFGSFASGYFNNQSDIDIAIYYNKKYSSIDEYINLKRRIALQLNRNIDLLVLNDATPLIKHEVITNGIILFSRNNHTLNSFKINVLFEYEDTKHLREYSYQQMINKLNEEVK